MVQIRLTREIFMVYIMGNILTLLGCKELCESRDSSDSRAEDCSINQTETLRSMVQIRLTREIFMVYIMGNI